MLKLLIKAPKAFWNIGLVQFFCWFAFMFMWTYTNGSSAANAFDAPTVEHLVDGVTKIVLDTKSLICGFLFSEQLHSWVFSLYCW